MPGLVGVLVGLFVVAVVTAGIVIGVVAVSEAMEAADLRRELDVARRQAAIANTTVETVVALVATAGRPR